MVEYYGWINLNQSTDGEGEDEIGSIVGKLKKIIKKIDFPERTLTLKPFNGDYVLNFIGNRNHFTKDVEEVFELFELVSVIAPGSYGLLYIRNDEDRINFNNFKVWRLARGRFESFDDTLLSPCNPVIED